MTAHGADELMIRSPHGFYISSTQKSGVAGLKPGAKRDLNRRKTQSKTDNSLGKADQSKRIRHNSRSKSLRLLRLPVKPMIWHPNHEASGLRQDGLLSTHQSLITTHFDDVTARCCGHKNKMVSSAGKRFWNGSRRRCKSIKSKSGAGK